METRASYLLVGAFSLLVVLGALGFVLWAAKSEKSQSVEYLIHFNQAVSGLSVGNDVALNGVRVGQVSQIKISQQNPEAVRVVIQVASDTPVRENSVASLEVRGITGLSVVAITGGTADSPLLKTPVDGQPAEIQSKPSGMQTIISTVPELITEINTLITRANSMFSPENAESVRTILTSVAQIAETLAAQRGAMENALKSLEEAGNNLATVSRSVDALATSAQDVLENQFRAAASSVDKAAKSINGFVATIEPGLQRVSREGMDDLQRLMAEARALLGRLSRLAAQMESDPRRFFFGNSLPEYSTP